MSVMLDFTCMLVTTVVRFTQTLELFHSEIKSIISSVKQDRSVWLLFSFCSYLCLRCSSLLWMWNKGQTRCSVVAPTSNFLLSVSYQPPALYLATFATNYYYSQYYCYCYYLLYILETVSQIVSLSSISYSITSHKYYWLIFCNWKINLCIWGEIKSTLERIYTQCLQTFSYRPSWPPSWGSAFWTKQIRGSGYLEFLALSSRYLWALYSCPRNRPEFTYTALSQNLFTFLCACHIFSSFCGKQRNSLFAVSSLVILLHLFFCWGHWHLVLLCGSESGFPYLLWIRR